MSAHVYVLLMQKAYRRNTQYRMAHMVNNTASAIFGFIYVAIWQAAASSPSAAAVGDVYTAERMTSYVAFNQSLLWITSFLQAGLGIPEVVRTGAISLEMLRPIDYHLHIFAREAGVLWYNLLYRTIPLATVFALTVGLYRPTHLHTYFWLAMALVLAMYNALCLHYLTGLASFWTVNVSWARNIFMTLHFGLSGFLVPIDLLPGILAPVAAILPLAGFQYIPARIYLEIAGGETLISPLIWAVILTVICRYVTFRARRKLEVQGG